MSPTQRRTAWVLALLGLAYLILLIFPNAQIYRTAEMKIDFSHDERVIYPIIEHMLGDAADFRELAWRLLIYGDYHYGYPFYFVSMLAVLPVRLIHGSDFVNYTQTNLLLLRVLVSALPMVLTAGVLAFFQTRFCSTWRAALVFLLVLAIPGVIRNNVRWWHPDALSVLCVALTLVFLARDRLRLGRNFFLAAAACGLATAIKLVGVFFVFALAGYVLAAWRTQGMALKQVAIRSAGFIGVMALVFVLANPFLFWASQREKAAAIQALKTQELAQGYQHDDPTYYQKGPRWWKDTLQQWYGPVPFLFLLLGLAAAGAAWGAYRLENRLLLAWVIPYSIYLLYFVAVKPDHYWLPVMLPLFSAGLNGVDFNPQGRYRWLRLVLSVVILGLVLWQMWDFVRYDYRHYMRVLVE